MKYLISESQKSRLIGVIINSLEKNGFIKTLDMFNITIPILIEIIGDTKLPKFNCDELNDITSKLIIDSVIKRNYTTKNYYIHIDMDDFVGSTYFSITKKETKGRLDGYATPYWEGRCSLPIDLDYFSGVDEDGDTFDYEITGQYSDILSLPKEYDTLQDIIDWMTNDYFEKIIKYCEPIFKQLEYDTYL